MSLEDHATPCGEVQSFRGRVGLVTGAGSAYGIGRSLVKKLAAGGARAVYACDLNTGNMASLQKEVQEMSPDCIVEGFELDVSSEDRTLDIVKSIVEKHGRFDFYFANAGYAKVRHINDVESSTLDMALNVMTKSVFYAIKIGGSAMMVTSKEKPSPGGSIVVTASVAGLNPSMGDIAYSTAKTAAIGLVKAGAVNLSASNIRVNGIAPGVTQTAIFANSDQADKAQSFVESGSEQDMKDSYKQFLATRGVDVDANPRYYYYRVAQPDEIANIGVFLASDLASAVNGHVITADSGRVDGGLAETHLGPVPALHPLI